MVSLLIDRGAYVNSKDEYGNTALIYAAINNNERIFGVIEEIHTMPNVMYLTKIRNKEEILELFRD
jgi:ankyrin repeat protein